MKKQHKIVAVALALILVLVGCSGQGSSGGGNQESGQVQQSGQNQGEQQSQEGSQVQQGGQENGQSQQGGQNQQGTAVQTGGQEAIKQVVEGIANYYKNAKAIKYDSVISTMGQEMTMSVSVDSNLNMKATSNLMGQSFEQYMMNENGQYTQYMTMDGSSYFKSPLPEAKAQIEDSLAKGGTAIPDSLLEIYQLSQDASGNYVLTASPAMSDIAKDEDFAKNLEGQTGPVGSMDFSQYKSRIYINAVVDKNDFHYIRLDIDMSELMSEMMTELTKDMDSSDIPFNFGEMDMKMTLVNMVTEGVEPIVLPPAAENATEMSGDMLNEIPMVNQ